jgi:hypothetical protein
MLSFVVESLVKYRLAPFVFYGNLDGQPNNRGVHCHHTYRRHAHLITVRRSLSLHLVRTSPTLQFDMRVPRILCAPVRRKPCRNPSTTTSLCLVTAQARIEECSLHCRVSQPEGTGILPCHERAERACACVVRATRIRVRAYSCVQSRSACIVI